MTEQKNQSKSFNERLESILFPEPNEIRYAKPESNIPTTEAGKNNKLLNFEINSPAIGAIALGVGLCGISLALIGIRLGPMARQAKIWNGCVQTTRNFLSDIPGFAQTEINDLQAMAVNLCNGSTPQKEERSSE